VFVQRLEVGRGLHALATRLGVADRVLFLPSISLEQLVALFQSATALLQPSLAEGFGLPALEAMACGSLVIAHAIPALAEVVGDAGCLVRAADGSELTHAMRRAVREPGWARDLGARGVERAKRFSWDRTAGLTWEVYREVAAVGRA
jgi:glycosyltransferase involved in cell wall biosynthesis